MIQAHVLLDPDVAKNMFRMFDKIQRVIDSMNFDSISSERKEELELLVQYTQSKVDSNSKVLLNFICTHNSRRSQFSQLWAQVASSYYGIPAKSYSGGVEVTAFNERAVDSLKRFGFVIDKDGDDNPRYSVKWSDEHDGIEMFSKLYDDVTNPASDFAAIMTCSHADENCPVVFGCEKRIAIRYEDPKEFDGTSEESTKYDERSLEIGTELFYVFSNVLIS